MWYDFQGKPLRDLTVCFLPSWILGPPCYKESWDEKPCGEVDQLSYMLWVSLAPSRMQVREPR